MIWNRTASRDSFVENQDMFSKMILLLAMMISLHQAVAQTTLSGIITDHKKMPVAGASISLENTWYGTTSGNDGRYSFSSPDTGTFRLVITMVGYKKFGRPVALKGSPLIVEATLQTETTEMQAITVSAGSFEASDKKRNTVLKPLDIVTTAGQMADVVAALKTLPGAQQVGETEGLFVRGGTGAETKVFIDGMMITNPFYSSVPDIAQRARFSPLLFKGTHFSTGGYSAKFGQGLSSVLTLETHDLPFRSETSMIISSAQLTLTRQQLWKEKNASAGFSINYNNLQPYYNVVPQKIHYGKPPEIINGELFGRLKTAKGMLKYYGYTNYNTIAFNKPDIGDDALQNFFQLNNRHLLSIATYAGQLNDHWKLTGGAGFSYNNDQVDIDTRRDGKPIAQFLPRLTNYTTQARAVFTRSFAGWSKLHIGAEYQHVTDKIHAKDSIPFITRTDDYTALFVESDWYLGPDLFIRFGVRHEYSALLGSMRISPRPSIAIKLRNGAQLSAAYGVYYQKPETNLLLRNPRLAFTKATHYLLNYEKITDGRILRGEVFYKRYQHLVMYPTSDPFAMTNNGTGYATGIELFWRDKKLMKHFDYWIAYSWLDTKRQFLDYPTSVQPGFAARHTLNVVMKQFVSTIATQFSFTYTYASGRPYYNPNLPVKDFMSQRTMDYHNLGCQVNYLTKIGNANTAIIISVNNVLGNTQVYGYRFAGGPDTSGLYREEAITPMAKRFYFVGAYLSIGVDRRKTIIDN